MTADRCDLCGAWTLSIVCDACVVEAADAVDEPRAPGDATAGAAACRAALAEVRARRQVTSS